MVLLRQKLLPVKMSVFYNDLRFAWVKFVYQFIAYETANFVLRIIFLNYQCNFLSNHNTEKYK